MHRYTVDLCVVTLDCYLDIYVYTYLHGSNLETYVCHANIINKRKMAVRLIEDAVLHRPFCEKQKIQYIVCAF